MKKFLFFIFFILTVFVKAQSLDPTFGNNGFQIIQNCSHGYIVSSLGVQSNGKSVHGFGGSTETYQNFGVYSRTNIDGTIDSTFGNDGYFYIDNSLNTILQSNSIYRVQNIEVQNDNKIVSVGYRYSTQTKFCIARILSNGGLDTTFNDNGFLEVDFGTIQNRGTCLKILPDNKILVGGISGNQSEFSSLIKLNSNGTLDTSFGTLGKVQTNINGSQCQANSIAIQSDGKIILAGSVLNNPNGYDFVLTRYLPNGTLDSSFGINGKVIRTINAFYDDVIYKVLVQNDGKIVVVGNTAENNDVRVVLVRYFSNGQIDSDFANSGVFTSNVFGGIGDAAIQIDNKLVVTSTVYNTSSNAYNINLFRLNPNGSLDDVFSPVNTVLSNIQFDSATRSLIIQPDNKILIGGESGVDNECGVVLGALVRINPGVLLSNDKFEEENVVVFPNPTSNEVRFDNSTTQFTKATVFNYLGQEVFSKNLSNSSQEMFEIGALSTGVYVLKLANGQIVKTLKIIKK